MKKLVYFSLMALILLCVSSCKKKTPLQKMEEFTSSLTSADTTQMLKLSNDCMELLKAKKIDNALSMLYEYNDSTKEVTPLTPQARKRYERMFRIFPVVDYELVYYSFQLEGINDVKYKIIFAQEENVAENGEAATALMFNPVKVDGTWYLTVKNTSRKPDERRN